MNLQCILKILKVNLRHNFIMHFSAAVVITLIIPVVFSITELDSSMSARPIEMILSLTGIVLLTPVFTPEQDTSISDVVRSKKTDHMFVCLIRVIYSLLSAVIITAAFIGFMKYCGSDVNMSYLAGGIITELFLGSLGMASAGISGSICAGYMVPFVYYIANIAGKDKFGNFYLFSMSSGSFNEKYYLLAASVVLLTFTLLFRYFTQKK